MANFITNTKWEKETDKVARQHNQSGFQAHYQSPTSRYFSQSFVKEHANLAQISQRALGFAPAQKTKTRKLILLKIENEY